MHAMQDLFNRALEMFDLLWQVLRLRQNNLQRLPLPVPVRNMLKEEVIDNNADNRAFDVEMEPAACVESDDSEIIPVVANEKSVLTEENA